jgi:hypothetical protein
MPIVVVCPHCDWEGRVPDNLAGRTGKCPTCGERIPIPKRGTRAVDDADIIDDADVVEDEPQPESRRPARRDDDDDDRPARTRRRPDDDEDRPARSRRRPADDDEEDEDEDDRPRRSRRLRRDEEEDDRPRRPRRKRRRRASGGVNTQMVVGGCIMLLIMIVWFVVGLAFGFCFYWPPIGSVIAIVAIVRGLMGASD